MSLSNCIQDNLLHAGDMFKPSSLAIFLLYISVRSMTAAVDLASAAGKVYPEVIPGPGLPSLASLGLTSTILYESKNCGVYIPLPASRD